MADGERLLRILINLSCHCSPEKFDGDMAFAYRHGRELRRFSAERFALSRHLPGMIQAIADKKVFFTRETNYLTVELVDHDGASVRYTMFFDLKRAHDAAHDLVMTVESAYIKVALPAISTRSGSAYSPGRWPEARRCDRPTTSRKENRPRRAY